VAQDVSNWTIVNQAPFMQGENNILGLDATSVSSATMTATVFSATSASTNAITTNQLVSQSGTASSIFIVQDSSLASFGNLYVSGGGNLGDTVSDSLRLANMSCLDLSSTDMTVSRNITYNGNTVTSYAIASQTVKSKVFSSVTVDGTSLSVNELVVKGIDISSASTDTVGCRQIKLGPGYITASTISAIGTPFLSTNTIRSSRAYTPSIYFSSFTGHPTSFIMSSATIQNSQGSLNISSVAASTSQITSITASMFSTGTVISGNLYTEEAIHISSLHTNGTLIATDLTIGNLSTNNVMTQTLTAGSLSTNLISPSSFTVSTSIALDGPAFYFPAAIINDASGMINTGVTRASVTKLQNVYTSTVAAPLIATPAVVTTEINTVTTSAVIANMDTLVINSQATLGHPFDYSTMTPNGPWVSTFVVVDPQQDLHDINIPPFQYGQGSGLYTDPFSVVATLSTDIRLSFNNPSGDPLYCNVRYRHVLPYPGIPYGSLVIAVNGNVRIVEIANYNFTDKNTLIIEGFIQDIQVNDFANYPLINPNPDTGDNTPFLEFSVYSGYITTDSMTMWISNKKYADDLASPSAMDPNAGIEMNVGSIRWPSTLYATTIQNDLNDIQTRSLLYTGSLQHISDRSLKKEIEPANLQRCATLIQEIPLRRYDYVPEFASTFRISDRTRLGILTTELSTLFPKSVREEKTPMGKTEVASLGQLKYAHLGATKFLMEEIAALQTEITRLK